MDDVGYTPAEGGGGWLGLPELEQRLPDGRARCTLCPHTCRLGESMAGRCGVRMNRGGRMLNLVYGRVVAAAAEPVEKKPLYHYVPGHRTYSLAAVGCNLRCRFCQNWEISQAKAPLGRAMTATEVVERAKALGCRSICFTFTEPIVNIEYVLDVAQLARPADLRMILLSGGYVSAIGLRLLTPWLDAVKIDLKAPTDALYRQLSGGRSSPVWAAVRALATAGVWVELSTVVLPEWGNAPDMVGRLARRIIAEVGVDTPWHLMRFFPNYEMAGRPPGTLAQVEVAIDTARAAGLRYVYVSNVPGHTAAATYCPTCGERLIGRAPSTGVVNWLRGERCPQCATPIAGCWSFEEVSG